MAEVTKLLGELIAFNTSQDTGITAMLSYIETYLKKFNVKIIRIPADHQHTPYSLMGKLQGDVSSPNILLSAHLDVVGAKNQVWESDPFILTQENNSLVGRGTVDMKGFIACILAMLPDFIEQRLNITLVFTYDEETTCGAIREVHRYLQQHPEPVQLAIVGEPSGGVVHNSCKGVSDYQVTLKGCSCHSSTPQRGKSAILAAVQAIALLNQRVSAYADSGLTTNVGLIQGGSAINIVADYCRFSFDLRAFSQTTIDGVLDEVQIQWQQLAQTLGVEIRLENLCKILPLTNTFTSRPDKVFSGATEAGYYQALGIPTIIYGPGELSQAHTANEHITLNELYDYQQVLRDIPANILAKLLG